MPTKDPIQELLSRSVDTVYPTAAALEKELRSGRTLRVYLGIDPTSPHLHLGHAASLWVLRRFQDLGHEVILLVGDFTARIGDPTDKLAARQPLTEADIAANMATFKEQASKIVRFTGKNPARFERNAGWHDRMTFKELLALARHFTVQQLEERDMFVKRRAEGKPINVTEFLYPIMQGYDSVALDVDVEVGGTDQTFNMLAGRTLLKAMKGKEKFVVTNKLLVDATSGKKLSKTEGSLVNLDDTPREMFGKVMAMPDGMLLQVAELSTDMAPDTMKALAKERNPRDAKLALAHEVVKTYHSAEAADTEQENWVRTFSKKEEPTDAPVLSVRAATPLLDLLIAAGVESKSEARRLILAKSIKLDDATHTDPTEKLSLKGGEILKVGKHRFFRIKTK